MHKSKTIKRTYLRQKNQQGTVNYLLIHKNIHSDIDWNSYFQIISSYKSEKMINAEFLKKNCDKKKLTIIIQYQNSSYSYFTRWKYLKKFIKFNK